MLETTGDRIKLAIDDCGLNQVYIADQIGVSKQAVNAWIKKNKIDTLNLLKVSRLTNHTMEWLIEGNGKGKYKNKRYIADYKDNRATSDYMEVNEEPVYGHLNAKEKNLIDMFRQLNDEQQSNILVSCSLFIAPQNNPGTGTRKANTNS